jgi:Putative adhesin Stv domain
MSGSFIARNKEFFEKKNQLRVVISGHGMRIPTDKQITVPDGMTICFYVLDGELTSNALGRAIEGFTGTGQIPQPVEIVSSGSPVWDYRLTWASDLTINATRAGAKYDLISIDEKDQNRSIPLSILLRDTRCRNAEIHWAACREIKPATSTMAKIGAFNSLQVLKDMGKNMSDLKAPPVFNP